MRVFADTHFFIALLSERDTAHEAALRRQREMDCHELVTTGWVLVELADGMTLPGEREVCAAFIECLRRASGTRIVPLSEELLWRGFDLYRRRQDKDWSLTDCISFVVMSDEGLSEALTGDHHFEQAGFTALLA